MRISESREVSKTSSISYIGNVKLTCPSLERRNPSPIAPFLVLIG